MNDPQNRQSRFNAALALVSHELYLKLASDYSYIRSVKLYHRKDGSWSATLATYDGDYLPAVCFGTGESIYGALRASARSLQSGHFKPDEYAREEDFAYGEILAKHDANPKAPQHGPK